MRGESYDLGSKAMGVAFWRGREPVHVGLVTLGYDSYAEQMFRFERALIERWDFGLSKPDWVAYEGAGFAIKSRAQAAMHHGLAAILNKVCFQHGVTLLEVPVATAKKALTGRGNAKKDDMLAVARRCYPHLDIAAHDQADALGVGLAFLAAAEFVEET